MNDTESATDVTTRGCTLVVLLALASLLGVRCTGGAGGSAGPGPDQGQPEPDAGGPQQIRVTQFTVAEAEERRVSANLEIISGEGIEIAGDLIVDPGDGGDIVLIAEDGDIVISGRIIVEQGATEETDKAVIRNAGSTPARSKATTTTSQTAPTLTPGVSITLRPIGPNRDIILRRYTLLQSGRGRDATDETVVTMASISHEGGAGSNGGDIILEAPLGTIRLPQDRQIGDPALFGLGSGGDGADVTVDRMGFDTDETSLTIVGGSGGNSGRLVFDAFNVEGVPEPEDLGMGEPRFVEGGFGGEGGDVEWENSLGGPTGDDPMLDKTYPLREIVVRGGVGGDGAVLGRKGGKAFYVSQRVINKIGDPIASVEARGGDGGDVFPSPVPVVLVEGGEGGEFAVWGNAGWNGGTAEDGTVYKDGADAGNVLGEGGNGGSVLEGTLFFAGRGGQGGNSAAATGRVPGGDYLLPGLGVVSARGGNGLDRCDDGCPGGKGGDGGRVSAFGGDGGSAPEGGNSGAGGNVWLAMRLEPGAGGDGNPPGAGGCPQERIVQPGAAGAGGPPHEPGQYEGEGWGGDQEDCAEDGQLCGEDIECPEDEAPPQPSDCSVPASYDVNILVTNIAPDSDWGETKYTETGVQLSEVQCEEAGYHHSCYSRTFKETERYLNNEGEIGERIVGEGTGTTNRPGFLGPEWSPYLMSHCTDSGELYLSSSGAGTETVHLPHGTPFYEVTWACTGCECFDRLSLMHAPPTRCCPSECRADQCPEDDSGSFALLFECIVDGTRCIRWTSTSEPTCPAE